MVSRHQECIYIAAGRKTLEKVIGKMSCARTVRHSVQLIRLVLLLFQGVKALPDLRHSSHRATLRIRVDNENLV